jgi:hypothetical protein
MTNLSIGTDLKIRSVICVFDDLFLNKRMRRQAKPSALSFEQMESKQHLTKTFIMQGTTASYVIYEHHQLIEP